MSSAVIEWGGRISSSGYGGVGRARRVLYKRERRPLRARGFIGNHPPLACRDASAKEIIHALGIVADRMGIQIGRVLDYDRAQDKYVVLGASTTPKAWEKIQEWRIPGEYVSTHIKMWRKVMGASGPADAASWRAAQKQQTTRLVIAKP